MVFIDINKGNEMKYKIDYIDNQGMKREAEVKASCFTNAVSELEKNANEVGHGVSVMTVRRVE